MAMVRRFNSGFIFYKMLSRILMAKNRFYNSDYDELSNEVEAENCIYK